ncbi:MAG: transcriptional regulator, partial [Pseudomonas sp. PGPPP3]
MNIDQIVDFAQSSATPEHYRPAPEKVLKGDPAQSVTTHNASPCGQFNTRIREGAPGQW